MHVLTERAKARQVSHENLPMRFAIGAARPNLNQLREILQVPAVFAES